MLSRNLVVISALLILQACSNTPPAQTPEIDAEETTASWRVLEDKMRCFPVNDDAFDHPIDQMPMPVAPDDSIWPRIQAGLTLEYVDNKAVNQQLAWYRRHPDYFNRVQKRASRYLYYIVQRLHEENVPFDIALLPIVESAFEPFSYSHGQASGLWQFIPMTGDRFRLDQNWWQDERRDPMQSTDAAIKYLKYLHRFFDDDWLLAVAAYNAGEGTVRNAVRKNRRKGLPIDFWSLDLPRETSAYVPKLIALSTMFQAPEENGITLLKIANKPYFSYVDLDSQLDLAQAASLADITIEELYYLNAELNRWATPPIKRYALKLPTHSIESFKENLAKLPPEQRVTWHRHTIKSGENLAVIAQKYNTQTSVIKEANGLTSSRIIAGKTLMIPSAQDGKGSYRYSQSARKNKRQNRAPSKNLSKYMHVVESGDSFWSIAKKHKVKIKSLAKWNNKSPKDTLKVGEQLVVWKKTNTGTPSGFRQAKTSKVLYRVRNGDSLSKVASKFNVKISQIVAWNNINPKQYIQPGQKLKLYINIMETY